MIFPAIDRQNWDRAAKALASLPTVIEKMSADLDWTIDLDDVEGNQPQDVVDVTQSPPGNVGRGDGRLAPTPNKDRPGSGQNPNSALTP